MSNPQTSTNRKKHPVKIIIIGVPKAVIHAINLLHLLKFANAGDWIEVKRTRVPEELMMTITIDFML